MKKIVYSLAAAMLVAGALLSLGARTTQTAATHSPSAQQATRKITLDWLKDAPVELTSIKYAGREVALGGQIPVEEGWHERLTLTFKNISERNVTYIEGVIVLKTSDTVGEGSLLFGTGNLSDSSVIIRLNETATLNLREPSGELNGAGAEVSILVLRAAWDGDDSLIWSSGRLQRKVPGSDPPRYEFADRPPAAAVVKPAGAAFLPAAAVDDPCIDPELCEYANTCPQVQDPDTNTSCGNIYPCGQLPNGGGTAGSQTLTGTTLRFLNSKT